MKKHFARLLLPLGVLCAAAALLFYPTQAAAGAKRGFGYCVDILIPSLFPFMALSVFVVKSGLAASMGRLTAGPCRILFGLPGFFRAPGIQNCRGMSLAAKICRRRFAAGRLIQSPWRIP